MKLVKVKVAYTCGLMIVETASVDPTTGELFLPPRLTGLMSQIEASECPPVFTLDYNGYPIHVHPNGAAEYAVTLPVGKGSIWRQFVDSIVYPREIQRHQNGRLIHTFGRDRECSGDRTCCAGVRLGVIESAVLQGGGAVLLWYVGFLCMKGD
ncbi:hypothetical protein BPMI_03201 [Candidatus Burkholderia pumila]|uniref:Uncharacterized protein n=1 Tax=Candidatus Burkholderia pumila TaxID=1090375 RepID=A0ABR5HP36_9BURK|nr:hypothetical protein BPMI_03201 [Candidatus Burkholderia pumila]